MPSATGRFPASDLERYLFALPSRLGGLGNSNPVYLSSGEFHASVKIIKPLQSLILSQTNSFIDDVRTLSLSLKMCATLDINTYRSNS